MLAVLAISRLAMGFQFQFIGSTAPLLVVDLAINYTSVGFLIGLYLLPGIVLALPTGLLGNRFGDKRVVVVGLLLMVTGGLIVGATDNYGFVVVGRLVSGTGAVLLNILLTKMLIDWFVDRELVLSMAILLNAWPIGIGLALMIQGPLAEVSSWSFVSMVTAGVACIGLLVVAKFYHNPSGHGLAKTAATKLTALSFKEAGLVSLAGMVWALFNVSYVVLWGFAPSLMIDRGMSVSEAGFIISFTTVLIIASVQVGGSFVQKYGRADTVIVLGIACFGVGMLLIPLVPSPLWIFGVIGVFGGAPASAIVAIPSEILQPDNRGTGMGLFMTWYYVAMAALTPIAGWFQDISGDSATPLYFGGFVMLAALPFFSLLRVQQRQIAE